MKAKRNFLWKILGNEEREQMIIRIKRKKKGENEKFVKKYQSNKRGNEIGVKQKASK